MEDPEQINNLLRANHTLTEVYTWALRPQKRVHLWSSISCLLALSTNTISQFIPSLLILKNINLILKSIILFLTSGISPPLLNT